MAILTSKEVCEQLGITLNNLYQLNYRKQLVWVKKEGKNAFYNADDVAALKAKRK